MQHRYGYAYRYRKDTDMWIRQISAKVKGAKMYRSIGYGYADTWYGVMLKYRGYIDNRWRVPGGSRGLLVESTGAPISAQWLLYQMESYKESSLACLYTYCCYSWWDENGKITSCFWCHIGCSTFSLFTMVVFPSFSVPLGLLLICHACVSISCLLPPKLC